MAKILLLEPDALLAKNTLGALKKSGHKISWQSGAQPAISAIDKQIPDLIIMELQLTGHSGVEFLYELQSYPEWQTIPVIIYSHIPNAGEPAKHWQQLGVVAYYYKPHTKLKELADSIDHILMTA